jgi:hypothetical protein
MAGRPSHLHLHGSGAALAQYPWPALPEEEDEPDGCDVPVTGSPDAFSTYQVPPKVAIP